MTILRKLWTGFGILILIFVVAGLTIGGGVRSTSRALGEIIGAEKFARLSPRHGPKEKVHRSEVQNGLCATLVPELREENKTAEVYSEGAGKRVNKLRALEEE